MTLDVFLAIKFYIITLLIGILCLPLTIKIFSKFSDKGYAAARIIGLLIISYIIWVFSNLKIMPFNETTLSLIIALLTGVSIYFYLKKPYYTEILSIKHKIFRTEAGYGIFYTLMILFRGAIPKIEGIEKYMDFAIINSILRSPYLPLNDVWYAGKTINYYYFGQYNLATLIKITNVPSSYGYNLCVAFLFANVCIITFSIVNTLTKSKFFGLISVILLAIGGNLDYVYKQYIVKKPDYFYAEARSLIDKTINEFPAYSFLISDLHAHIVNIPNVLVFLALATNVYLKKKIQAIDIISIGFILGIIFITNSWDYIIYGILTAILFEVIENSHSKKLIDVIKNTGIKGVITLAISTVPFLFFHLNFKPAVGGVGFVTHDHSDFLSVFIMFGTFWLFCLPLLIFGIYKIVKSKIINWPLKINKTQIDFLTTLTTNKFVFILLVLGLVLVVVPDIIFLKDIYFYSNPPYFRANTVFKVWYQAWIILSIVSGYSLKLLYDKISKFKINWVFYNAAILLAVIFLTCLYTLNGINYIFGQKYTFKTLDGADFINESYANHKSAIDWINRNIDGDPKLLEVYGQSYTLQSMFSVFTGLSVPVGWRDHEFGWRNDWPELSERLGEIELMYRSEDLTEVTRLLNKYQIEYIVVGKFEREVLEKDGYTNIGSSIAKLSMPVYSNEEVTIYKYR